MSLTSPVSVSAKESVTCSSIPLLGKWSLEHHVVGLRDKDLPKFTEQLAVNLLETLDPHKVLFTRDELDALKRITPAGWKQVQNEKKCDRLAAWIERHYAHARERLFARANTIELDRGLVSPELLDSNESEMEEYAELAATSAELTRRTDKLVESLLKSAYPQLLGTYNNDLRSYLSDALDQVIGREISVGDLLAKAMLRAIDEYSTFLTEQEYEEFYDDLAGGTSGIGVRVRKTPKGLLVEKVLKGSPAQASRRIVPGDVIVSIEGKPIASEPLAASKEMLKGELGSLVKVELERQRANHTMRFTVRLQRSRFDFDESRVTHELHGKKNKVLVISIPSFYGRGGDGEEEHSVSEDVEKVLKDQLKAHKLSGVVIDLRDNPGGYLEEAVSLAGLFLGDKAIAGALERNRRRVFRSDLQPVVYSGPLAVLLDSGSASAAEVFAGALKDYQRAVLVGSPTTYGKGTVQRLYHVEDELLSAQMIADQVLKGVVKLTTSIFYSPLGHSPADGGVSTHVTLIPRKDDATPRPKSLRNMDYDVDPFVADPEIEHLRASAKEYEKTLAALRSRSRGRMGELSKELSETRVVEESVAIVSDLASLRPGGIATAE